MIHSLANKLLDKLGFQNTIEKATDCDHLFFVDIFEQALSEKLPGMCIKITHPKHFFLLYLFQILKWTLVKILLLYTISM